MTELKSTTSHYISFTYSGQVDKEKVFLNFETVWQKKPVNVQMSCDRYRHSSGINEWRVYAQRAVFADNEHPVTDLARRRLSEQLTPLAKEWLTTDAYRASEANAILHALKKHLQESRYRGSNSTRQILQQDEIQRKLSAVSKILIENACDAFDAYETALDLIK